MTALETKTRILQGFKEISDLHSWVVLDLANNILSVAKNQNPDGDTVIKRKGALYLCQKPPQQNLLVPSVRLFMCCIVLLLRILYLSESDVGLTSQ